GDLGTSHLVARQELRGLVANLRLPANDTETLAEAVQ
ncbi:MAG: chromosome partitioning protein, partial [Qipengyuania sp.]